MCFGRILAWYILLLTGPRFCDLANKNADKVEEADIVSSWLNSSVRTDYFFLTKENLTLQVETK